MIYILLSLGIVILLALNLWALGYCFIYFGDSKEDNTRYWPIWIIIIYVISIIFMLLLYRVKQ